MSDLSTPSGFKVTEAGMIPNDWNAALARDILVINRGRVISHRDLAQHPGPYPVYSSQTKDNGVMGFLDTFDFEGDYLTWTTDGANAGTVFFRTGKFNCTNVCGAGRVRNPAESSAQFYAYFLNTVAWKHVSHVGNPKLMSGPFGSIPVIVPPLPEQQAIAAALSDADGVVAGLERVIAKKRLIKQGAMQDLLTARRRLPGFSGEWEVKRLGDVARVATGGRNNQDKDPMGEYPFFVRSDTVERIRSFSYDCEAILVPGEGRIGEIFHYINGRFDVHQRVYCISAFSEETSGRFIYFVLRQFFGAHAMINTVKATVDSLRRPTFTGFEFRCPPSFSEQQAIAAVLSDMDAEIQALESRLTKARAVKEGMMQNLLTGRVRLV
ncbi:MAG: restriction endonuclease subunit S [Paracoccus sp. (in: a-proteobacteria)]|uniref:restriction endonuclease subunit S n=1 Tax=Paracoccus sp. TaxID=267 RepID=UPI0040598559